MRWNFARILALLLILAAVVTMYIVLVGYEWRLLTEGESGFVSYWLGIPLHYPA